MGVFFVVVVILKGGIRAVVTRIFRMAWVVRVFGVLRMARILWFFRFVWVAWVVTFFDRRGRSRPQGILGNLGQATVSAQNTAQVPFLGRMGCFRHLPSGRGVRLFSCGPAFGLASIRTLAASIEHHSGPQ